MGPKPTVALFDQLSEDQTPHPDVCWLGLGLVLIWYTQGIPQFTFNIPEICPSLTGQRKPRDRLLLFKQLLLKQHVLS